MYFFGSDDYISVLKDAKERHAIEEVVDAIEKGNNIKYVYPHPFLCFPKN